MFIYYLLNEICNFFKNSNSSDIIALLTAIIALCALLFSIKTNNQNNKRYIDSLKPLLSFEFYQINEVLLLSIKNTGMSEATKIKIKFKKLNNNGYNNKFSLDDLFKKEFMLYPTEEVQGIIGYYDNGIDHTSFPSIDIEISYIEGNDNKKIAYSRTISFKRNIYNRNQFTKMEDSLESISYSNNRLANYVEGTTLFTFDRINRIPTNSLYKDIRDAINNIDRPENNSDTKQETLE